MHSAIVSIPAFGLQKAYKTGQCSGDKDSCVLQFRNASLQQNRAAEKPDCGFCTYQAMLEVEEQMAIEAVLDDWSDTEEDVVVQEWSEDVEEQGTLNAAKKKKGPHAAARPDKQFAYVPKDAKGEDGTKSARKFPIYDAAHVRNALARFSQAKLPSGQKSAVLAKICRAARRFGIDSELCSSRTSNAASASNAQDFGIIEQTNNLNTSHVTNSTKFEIDNHLSDNTENVAKKTENVVRNSTTIPEQNVVAERTTTTESVQQPNQQPQQEQQQVNVERTQYSSPQATTVRAREGNNNNNNDANNNNAGNTSNASSGGNNTKTNQLIELLVQNERRQKQLQAAYQEINKLARDNERLVKESTTYNTKLASLEKYVQEQQKLARENQIAEIVYSAGLSQFVPDEVKEEQVKLLVASPFKVEDIQKLTAPWYTAFDTFVSQQREEGLQAAPPQVPTFTASPTTKVASQQQQQQQARLPLGSVPRDTNTKNASLQAPTRSSNNKSTKPAFIAARELMGIVDTSNGGASY